MSIFCVTTSIVVANCSISSLAVDAVAATADLNKQPPIFVVLATHFCRTGFASSDRLNLCPAPVCFGAIGSDKGKFDGYFGVQENI